MKRFSFAIIFTRYCKGLHCHLQHTEVLALKPKSVQRNYCKLNYNIKLQKHLRRMNKSKITMKN